MITQEEANILKDFFSYVFEQTEAGYVFEGMKPMCIHGTGDNSEMLAGSPLHKTSVVLSTGINVWNDKIKPHVTKSEFIIKFFENNDSKNHTKYLLFINKNFF